MQSATLRSTLTRALTPSLAILMLSAAASGALAQKKYDTGASDTEIKIGQTVPHSGPASMLGVGGRVTAAYFEHINAQGGINGRKVRFITLDDAYSAAKTVEATRRLVEQEEVLALFGSVGTAPQSAVQKYLNAKGVPQLMIGSGSSKWNDPVKNKWSLSSMVLYPTDARVLAKYLVSKKPDAKVGILFQNDDFGRDFLAPFKDELAKASGGRATVVAEYSFDVTDPTIDSQMINLSKSGADVFYNAASGKAVSQSIRKIAELGWKPLHLLNGANTGRALLNAGGADNAKGIVAIRYTKEPGLPGAENDPDVKAYEALRVKYFPMVDRDNSTAFAAYGGAVAIGEVLRRAGDNLTRENILKQTLSLKGYRSPAMMEGVTFDFTAEDYTPIRRMYVATFNGDGWDLGAELVGD